MHIELNEYDCFFYYLLSFVYPVSFASRSFVELVPVFDMFYVFANIIVFIYRPLNFILYLNLIDYADSKYLCMDAFYSESYLVACQKLSNKFSFFNSCRQSYS